MRHLRPPRMNPAIDLAPYRGKSAADLVATVKAHRKTVNTTKELTRGREILAKHGYKTAEKLGKGQAATVYALAEFPKYVAKLTHDPLDAAIMAELQVLGVRPGLPDVVGVADLGNGLYGIIIERLLPLTEQEDRLVDALGEQTGWGRMAHASVWKHYKGKPRQTELLEAAQTVRALGFTPTDIGAGNVMKRADGSWVVSDLGFSKPSDTATTRDIKRLRNPSARNPAHSLRRNPVPAHIRSTRRNPITDLREFDASAGYDDVQNAVFSYAPEVEWYKDEFRALDDYALGILARHGVEVESGVLGSGAMARVYALADDPDWVVKITTDPTDAALMAEAQFAEPLRGTPGIPKVASVFDLGPSPVRPDVFPGHIYAIVVERMTPLSSADKLKARALSSKYQRGWLADPATVAERLKQAAPGSVEEAWLRGVAFVYAMGFRPTDLHANNIMQRKDGSFAFSDFGVSGVEGRTASRDIPSLGDVASKKNAKSIRARSAAEAKRRKAAEKKKMDDIYAELEAAGFSSVVEAMREASASEATRPTPKKRKNPMTVAEHAAHLQTQYDTALARMERKPDLREDEDYVEFVEDIRRKLEAANRLLKGNERAEADRVAAPAKARDHAERFVRMLEEAGGPKHLRVWQKDTVGTRIYFPGDLGFVSVGADGSINTTLRGKQTLAVTSLYPAWRRAFNAALQQHARGA